MAEITVSPLLIGDHGAPVFRRTDNVEWATTAILAGLDIPADKHDLLASRIQNALRVLMREPSSG